MNPNELRDRCRLFMFGVIDVCASLGHDDLVRVVRPQLLRSATSVAANQRASRRARSRKEFAARLGVVVEEADECELWLDICEVRKYGPAEKVRALRREAIELTAMFARARSTTLENLKRRRER